MIGVTTGGAVAGAVPFRMGTHREGDWMRGASAAAHPGPQARTYWLNQATVRFHDWGAVTLL